MEIELDPPLSTGNITDPWKKELYERLDRMRKKCGVVCTINDKETYDKYAIRNEPEPRYDESSTVSDSTTSAPDRFQVPIDCDSIFEMDEIDASDLTFPYPVPEELLPFYTLNGMIPVDHRARWKSEYLNSTSNSLVWTKDYIEQSLASLKNGTFEGTYGKSVSNEIRDYISSKMDLVGKSVLVVGSELPWVEVCALAAGASKVTTLEYAEIHSTHPQIQTMNPKEFRTYNLQNNKNTAREQYDVILSFSSLEHSGLGRYGDALNPWGDILSLARVWCVTKPKGQLMLGLPVAKDYIRFNAHRGYGNIRWPLITNNWIPLDGVVDFEKGRESGGGTTHLFEKVS